MKREGKRISLAGTVRLAMAILYILTYRRAASNIVMRESETDWSLCVIAAVIATVYSHMFYVLFQGFRLGRHEPIWRLRKQLSFIPPGSMQQFYLAVWSFSLSGGAQREGSRVASSSQRVAPGSVHL